VEGLPEIKDPQLGFQLVKDPDVINAYSQDALGIKGNFEAIVRPKGEEEVLDVISYCYNTSKKLTPQGLRTSLTGASMAEEGIALCLEEMNSILDVDEKAKVAYVQPGVPTGDLRRFFSTLGLMYPPDPTSQKECTIGGNVATNASGSRSLKFGSTGDWVCYLRVIDGTGKVHEFYTRKGLKSACGPRIFQNSVDIIVGSEGIFGVITKIGLRLIDKPPDSIIFVVFFEDVYKALQFVTHVILHKKKLPAAMELLDEYCMSLLEGMEGYYAPKGSRCIIYFEEDIWDDTNEDQLLESWYQLIERHTKLSQDTILLRSNRQKEGFKQLRHRVPEALNEESIRAAKHGGLKISTDWVVPLENITKIFRFFDELRPMLKDMPVARYGHIGSGHPHFNIIARDEREKELAKEAEKRLVLKALELDGTISGEHGIGKLKKGYLSLMYPQEVISTLKSVKNILDPKWILSPGNII